MRLSRRGVLLGTGAGLLLAPFERLLRPRPARAQAVAGGGCRRIIFFFSPNGTVHQHWRPAGQGGAVDFAPGSILEPLAAQRQRLIVLDGLNFEYVRGGSHEGGMEHMLTGGGAPSVDQYIAGQLGGASPFPSVELSVQTSAWGAGIQTRMSYDGTHGFVHPEDDPAAAFARLFGGVAPQAGDQAGMEDPRAAGRRSVLDLVRGEVSALRRQLGQVERHKLDAHLEALRRVEQRIDGFSVPLGCEAPAAPGVLAKDDNDNFPEVAALQMALLVRAAACDLAPVYSLQMSHTVSPTIFSWAGVGEGHHELSHKDDGNTAGVADFVAAERWVAGQFAALLDMLEQTPDPGGDGSLLDHSQVVWTKELGDARLHDFESVPFVLAGGGRFAPGRYLDCGGQPHQKLLVSLCEAMGLSNQTFGVDQVSGPLGELG